MRIAIYGDSFAAEYLSGAPVEFHWGYKLGKMLDVEVTNFAEIASSTFYSYKIFLENYKNYDVNIFLVTTPYRYTKPLTFKNIDLKRHFHNIDMIYNFTTQHDKKLFTSKELDFLTHLESWFIASDDDFMVNMQSLIVEDIIRKDNNVILYPCFENCIPTNLQNKIGKKFNHNMVNWMHKAHHYFGINKNYGDYQERLEVIACHMTEEINVKFAEAMYNYIKIGKEITLPEVVEHKHNFEYYYTRR